MYKQQTMPTQPVAQAVGGKKDKKAKQATGHGQHIQRHKQPNHKVIASETPTTKETQVTSDIRKCKPSSKPIDSIKKIKPVNRDQSHIKGHSNQAVPDSPDAKGQHTNKSSKQKSKAVDSEGVERQKEETRRMLESYPVEKLVAFMLRHGIGEIQDFAPLRSDLLVKEIGSFYYCALCCKRYRNQEDNVDQHLDSKAHRDAFNELEMALRKTLPKDNSIQSAAADLLIQSWIEPNLLTEQDRERRTLAISRFGDIISEISPECKFRIIGSFLTGASQRDSDVNLELLHPNSKIFEADPRAKDSLHHKLVDPDAEYGSQINHHTLHYDLIGNAVESLYRIALSLLHGTQEFEVLSRIEDLTTKVPELVLHYLPTDITLRVCCYAEASYKLTCLLRNYLYLDERALQLCILVKHWARICRIVRPKHGTLSSDTLSILVIHYLQRTEPPVLPCLHDLLRKKSRNREEAGLEDQLNSLNLESSSRDTDQISDTNYIRPEGAVYNNNNANPELIEKEASEEEEGEEDEEENDDEICSEFDMSSIESLNWLSPNKSSIRELFLDFLRFSMSEFASVDRVISIRTLKKVTMASKRWNNQVKAVENPVKPKINLTRTVGSMQSFNYIRSCFGHAFYYLTSLPKPKQRRENPLNYTKFYINLKRFDFYFSMKEGNIKASKKTDTISEMITQDLFARDVEAINALIEHFIVNRKELDLIPKAVFNCYEIKHMLPPSDDSSNDPTIFCWFCKRNGHSKEMCREKEIGRDNVNTNNSLLLDRTINFDNGFLKLYTEDMISEEIHIEHTQILHSLEESIRNGLNLDCHLTLFGSTVNLLGSCDSDLDICMTLNGNLTGRGVDCVGILDAVSRLLVENPNVHDIEPILAARVPIIRFCYKDYDIDLCMYNQCAIHNSRLLKTYVLIDFRLAQLYYLVKRFAKACDIADASKGSLSSYAWSLLVIHFMQHTNPPMLPVLQEPPRNKNKELFGVGGWNVWFNDDVASIQMPSRSISLTSLFKEFLLYYTNFDFNKRVVSIRTSQVINKFQKNWNNCTIAIEDPFELTYNLSSRLDEQMAVYIMQTFPRAYQHICHIQNKCRSQNNVNAPLQIVKRIFERSSIMHQPPPYRGCRRCHKIGHRVANCPNKIAKKKTNDKVPGVEATGS